MSVTYEVNLKVQKKVEKEFKGWLLGHIQDVLAIDGFKSATWFRVHQNETENDVTWTVHYVLRDQSSLDSYLKNHAARLRKTATDQFESKFVAERRTLEFIQTFSK